MPPAGGAVRPSVPRSLNDGLRGGGEGVVGRRRAQQSLDVRLDCGEKAIVRVQDEGCDLHAAGGSAVGGGMETWGGTMGPRMGPMDQMGPHDLGKVELEGVE